MTLHDELEGMWKEPFVAYFNVLSKHEPWGTEENHRKQIRTSGTTVWSRVILDKLIVAQVVKNSPPFMEPEGLLPCSLEPAAAPYPEPDEMRQIFL
jgi:hypothetical protein